MDQESLPKIHRTAAVADGDRHQSQTEAGELIDNYVLMLHQNQENAVMLLDELRANSNVDHDEWYKGLLRRLYEETEGLNGAGETEGLRHVRLLSVLDPSVATDIPSGGEAKRSWGLRGSTVTPQPGSINADFSSSISLTDAQMEGQRQADLKLLDDRYQYLRRNDEKAASRMLAMWFSIVNDEPFDANLWYNSDGEEDTTSSGASSRRSSLGGVSGAKQGANGTENL